MAMDDYDVEDLTNEKKVYCVISTAGQGELPKNSEKFYKAL